MKWGIFMTHHTQQGLYPIWPCLMVPSLVFYAKAQKQPASIFTLQYHSLIKDSVHENKGIHQQS